MNTVMRIFLSLFSIMMITLMTNASVTTIKGHVAGAGGQVIRLLAFDDFISEKLITLASSEIDNEGRFLLEADIGGITHAFLDINYQRAEIFLEPGKACELEIRFNAENQLSSYFDRQGLEYELLDADPGEINNRIWQFNKMYNRFIMEDFERIVTLHDKSLVAAFKEEVNAVFGEPEEGYFYDYIRYKIAGVEQFARLKGNAMLAAEYFTAQPILYGNVEYAYFFNQFFEKFLITSPEVITISDLIIAVNEKNDLDLIRQALAGVSWLPDPDFRELILLHGLKELYHNGTFKKEKVLSLIGMLKSETTNPIHERIAANLLETLPRLSPGMPAPDLSLTLSDGTKTRLHDIKGKPVLLIFFRSGQKGMERQFDTLTEIYNVYRAGLEIISISMDGSWTAQNIFYDNDRYPWTFAHYGNRPEVYDLYNIRDLPLFVIINAEGNIALYPAPSPGDELERELLKVIH